MAEMRDSYSFSDDFYSFLDRAARQDPAAQAAESASEETSVEEDSDEPEIDYDQMQRDNDDLKSQNEKLAKELRSLRFSDNSAIKSDDYLSYAIDGGDASSVLNMVMADEVNENWSGSTGLNIPVKSDNVNLGGVTPTLTGYVNSLTKRFGSKILATSGNDQKHAPGSKHYSGNALDLRYFPEVHEYIAKDPVAKKLGLKVLPPKHGTAPHTHIEKRQYGGEGEGGVFNNDLDNKSMKMYQKPFNQLTPEQRLILNPPAPVERKPNMNQVRELSP
jgi:hypothetical protein